MKAREMTSSKVDQPDLGTNPSRKREQVMLQMGAQKFGSLPLFVKPPSTEECRHYIPCS
jgi:hypothetical protein